MTENIISTYKTAIESLPWIDRYGGLVRKAIQTKVDPENGLIYQNSYPVSSDVDGRCFETGRYKDLIPDDKFKSISFFENYGQSQVADATFMGRDTIKIKSNVRFVCWLNLKKLGITKDYNPEFALNFMDLISKSHPKVDGVLEYSIKAIGLSFRNEDVFAEYTFNDKISMLMYPYDFFAVTFEIVIHIQRGCIHAIDLENAIVC